MINVFMHNFWGFEDATQRAHEMQNFIKNHDLSAPRTSSTTFNSLSQKLNPTQNSEQAQEYDEL